MAQKDRDGGADYTMVGFVENGKTTWRRMHQLDVQARDGQRYTFEGRKLPDSFMFYSGISHKDSHLGTVLGLPRERVPRSLASFVPGPRDWMYVITGAASVLMLKAALILAASPY